MIQPAPRISVSTRLLAALLIAVSVLAGAPAVAQMPVPPPAPDEAVGRKHFEKGQELYNKNRFLEAAREFEAGYQALPRSAFLLNIGHSYRRAYELRKAKAAYEQMLKVEPTSPHRPLVEDLIRTIDDALIAQEPPAATTPSAVAPMSMSPPSPSAGSASTGGSSIDLSPPMVAADAEPVASESRSIFSSPWFWGAVGAAVVTGVVATVLLANRSPGCRAQDCFAAP